MTTNTPLARLDPSRWNAVLERRGSLDETFVYAVKTTGVFCRPSCSSRKPRPDNVEFFDTPEAARRAGYRACKRCSPEAQEPMSPRVRAVTALCRYIDRSAAPPKVTELAREVGWSVSHLSRVFREVTGISPKRYIAGCRAERVRAGLVAARRAGDTEPSITRAMLFAGYSSNGRFYEDAPDQLGMTPTTYREGGAGEVIRFAIGNTSLGEALVACTPKGVCAVLLGDDADQLIRLLEERFPRARLVPGDADLDERVGRVLDLVERPAAVPDLPLDLRGTAFQRRVWDALRRIPSGSITTYTDLARSIGAPTAARAVATACAANAIAIAVPCHRVVRKDGSLSGYRWGVERKRALLERERARVPHNLDGPSAKANRSSRR